MTTAPVTPAPGGRRSSRSRSWFLRSLGVLIAVGLLWVALSRVPWVDELTVEMAPEAGAHVYSGELLDDWRGDQIHFRFDPQTSLAADSPLVGTFLEPLILEGGAVQATDGLLLTSEPVPGVAALDQARWEGSVSWHPGMPRAFRDLDPRGLVLALGFVLLCVLSIVTRWWRLLAMAGCPTPWPVCLRLTFVGLFFNTVLPGSTGGDLPRAYVVVRDHPERRAGALASVVVDRVVGLVAMTLLAAGVVATGNERFAFLLPWVLGAAAALVCALAAFTHEGLRRRLHFDTLLSKLPQGWRLVLLGSSIRSLLTRPAGMAFALLMSFANHIFATAAVYSLGHAFGATLGFHDFLCISTVANTLTAVPLSPGGLGVGEVLYGSLFEVAGALYMLGVASSFTYRLVMMAAGLLGGLALFLPGGNSVRAQFEEGRRAARDQPD